jgi:hypothetical protein
VHGDVLGQRRGLARRRAELWSSAAGQSTSGGCGFAWAGARRAGWAASRIPCPSSVLRDAPPRMTEYTWPANHWSPARRLDAVVEAPPEAAP